MNTKQSPIVYVVQEPGGKELSAANKFGTFKIILNGRETTDEAQKKLADTLFDFEPQDFLLPIGKSINMGMAMMEAGYALEFGDNLKVLVWRQNLQDYTVETVKI